jgi:MYXO-CTERM domain-containing protein
MNNNCSTIDATTGAFVGGPVAGQVQVLALDSQGAEAQAVVYTTGMPDAGPVADSGTDAGDAAVVQDSGSASDGGVAQDAAPATDGAASDGGAAKTATGGCACNAAGERGSRASLLGGVVLGLIGLARRRKRST